MVVGDSAWRNMKRSRGKGGNDSEAVRGGSSGILQEVVTSACPIKSFYLVVQYLNVLYNYVTYNHLCLPGVLWHGRLGTKTFCKDKILHLKKHCFGWSRTRGCVSSNPEGLQLALGAKCQALEMFWSRASLVQATGIWRVYLIGLTSSCFSIVRSMPCCSHHPSFRPQVQNRRILSQKQHSQP